MHDHGGWAQNIEVIPALDGTSKPYGSAVSYCFHSLVGWTKNKDTGYDYGVIILPENAALGQKTGWFGYGYKTDDSYFKNRAITLSGYPGDKGGSQQWGMSGKGTGVTNSGRKFAYQIDTYGGTKRLSCLGVRKQRLLCERHSYHRKFQFQLCHKNKQEYL
jgi:V8-like Glu-specific endopeptidase